MQYVIFPNSGQLIGQIKGDQQQTTEWQGFYIVYTSIYVYSYPKKSDSFSGQIHSSPWMRTVTRLGI